MQVATYQNSFRPESYIAVKKLATPEQKAATNIFETAKHRIGMRVAY